MNHEIEVEVNWNNNIYNNYFKNQQNQPRNFYKIDDYF